MPTGTLMPKSCLHWRLTKTAQSVLPQFTEALSFLKELELIDENRLGRSSCYYEAKGSPDHQHLYAVNVEKWLILIAL